MGCSNLIYGSRALHNFVKAYANVVNSMAYFVKTNPQTNVKKMRPNFPNTVSNKYFKSLVRKSRLKCKKNSNSFVTI